MQCSKLTSARQPQADDFGSGLTNILKNRYLSARMADILVPQLNINAIFISRNVCFPTYMCFCVSQLILYVCTNRTKNNSSG